MKGANDGDLMSFADGEVDELTAREVEDRMGRDPGARAKVRAVGEIGELVRGHLELSADAVPTKKFDALWREIDKRLVNERETESAPVKQAARAGALRRIGRWFDQHRGHVITGAVSAGAVGALALILRGPGADDVGGRAPIEAAPAAYRPAEIESLDTPGGTGTVFNMEDEDGSTTVIWVTPEDTVEGI